MVSNANPIVTPTSGIGVRSGSIGPDLGDEDWYAVTVPSRSLLHISADGDPERDGIGTDLILDLFGTDGLTLLQSANSSKAGIPGDPPAEAFGYVVSKPGTYYVRVRGAAGVTGTYWLTVASCGAAVPTLRLAHAGNDFELSWPADAHSFRLQSSPDLQLWQDEPVELRLVGESVSALVAPSPGPKFFRLIGL